MEVNLKALQDASANTQPVPARRVSFFVASGADAGSPSKTVSATTEAEKGGRTKNAGSAATEPKPELSEKQLEPVLADLTEFMKSLNTDIEFSVHERTGRMMVKVVDGKSHEVLKEFPPEELLDTIAAISEYVGVLLDRKA